MSVVTSIILTVSCAEPGFDIDEDETFKIDAINGFIRDHEKIPLNYLTPNMHNGRHPQTFTFGGGYNYFPDGEFLEFMASLDWESSENVVLVIQPDQGATIVWRPASFRW